MNHSLMTRIRMIKITDILSGIKMLIAFFLIPFFYFKEKELWLICESENEARDNGFWLFKYIVTNHPEINIVYAINNKSPDYSKVKSLGRVCQYGSVFHWVFYFLAKYNISTQKGGKPNAAICYVLEIYGILKNTRIFLQHGITYNDAEWLYYCNTKMRLFVCGASPEYHYVKNNFGYPEENVKYLGFCRFDNLINSPKTLKKRRILVMPTWREWLVSKTEMYKETHYDGNFENTLYFRKWSSFLNNQLLHKILNDNDIELFFYPHRNMQPFLDKFTITNQNIVLASWKDYDIQDLLINSDMMITDYSSVAFDYAYLKKPIVFFQFDYDDFRKGQYKEGYFDFNNQKLGAICYEEIEVINNINDIINKDYVLSEEENDYIDRFFTLRDNRNCERTFNEIKSI